MTTGTLSKAKLLTRTQFLAQKSRECIMKRAISDEYLSFSKRFPSLIHGCGLAQAVAFAESKANENLLDLANVLEVPNLGEKSRSVELFEYMALSRRALEAATWLKRYAEAKAGSTCEDS